MNAYLTIAAAAALACAVAPRGDQPAVAPDGDPITVAASVTGRFADGTRGCYLSLNSAGRGELTVTGRGGRTTRRVRLSAAQMARLRKAIEDEGFLDLKGAYGEAVPDAGESALTITVGGRSKTVTFGSFNNWLADPGKGRAKLRAAAPALRVWCLVGDLADPAGEVLGKADPALVRAIAR